MSGKLAGLLAGSFIVATSAGTWAAYSYSYAAAVQMNQAAAAEAAAAQPISNANTKADRLRAALPVAVQSFVAPQPAPPSASYALASLAPAEVEAPKLRTEPRVELRTEPRVDLRRPAAASAQEKAKRAEQQKLMLDDAQIASLRTRLKLTPTQEEFWPAVEETLREVVRQHARKSRRAPAQIDVNSPEVQQLIAAAVPLIMRLSEEQKREVRALARVMGLETVAAKI